MYVLQSTSDGISGFDVEYKGSLCVLTQSVGLTDRMDSVGCDIVGAYFYCSSRLIVVV